MSVRLRLSPHRRIPSSQQIYYRIVACRARKARDSQPLDTVGAYDPIPRHVPVVPASERSLLEEGKKPQTRWIKRVEWDREKVEHWLKVGAEPTKRVAWLLQKDNLSAFLENCRLAFEVYEKSVHAADDLVVWLLRPVVSAVPPGKSFHGYRGPSKPSPKEPTSSTSEAPSQTESTSS